MTTQNTSHSPKMFEKCLPLI